MPICSTLLLLRVARLAVVASMESTRMYVCLGGCWTAGCECFKREGRANGPDTLRSQFVHQLGRVAIRSLSHRQTDRHRQTDAESRHIERESQPIHISFCHPHHTRMGSIDTRSTRQSLWHISRSIQRLTADSQ
mmetsp:Transcript_37342/g.106850  ORF Transcript_37342/g.106850 Transcript_37342/m.106850 type:complete len:134 (-) Transcript_37342:698-1099(-)